MTDDAPVPLPHVPADPRPGRRSVLRATVVGAASAGAGAAAGVGAAQYRHQHLSPTERVSPVPSPGRRRTEVVLQASPSAGAVSLTFDDGPDPRWTPLVLDMLAELGATATFFVLGEAVEVHHDLVARQVAQGHEVAVHGWEHLGVERYEPEELRRAVERTCAAIEEAGAPRPALWRPPYGRLDAPALWTASETGLDVVLWGVNTPGAAEAARVAERATAGTIVLCHDGRSQPSEALFTALADSLRRLRDGGLEIVSASELLARSD